ncbi:MAG: nucleotidyltransferase family protein [Actinomycetota bacterium]|nr:nucleotidyltransferase family protein [Actinomycetota bacterium]
MPHPQLPTGSGFAIARSLMVDRMTAEVIGALSRRGVEAIALKGASFAVWLYRDGAVRSYGDCDVLVAPDQVAAAQQVLRDLGFRDYSAPLAHPRLESHAWRRDPDWVDLHETLIGMRVHPEEVWGTLSRRTESQRIGGASLRVLDPVARTLHVALHAAQHGKDEQKPLDDLGRALELLPEELWTEAAELAERLGATEAFATGLRLLPQGHALASRLGLGDAGSVESTLLIDPVPLALGFEHLSTVPGVGAKGLIVLRELVPTPAFMRWWSPLARRGPAGLALAYCWRLVWLATQAVPGFLAWRRARRKS